MTGTIKRAPCDLLLNGRRHSSITDRRSSSDGIASPSGRSGGTADSDSDEEQFPPPPPTVVATLSQVADDYRDERYSSQSSTPTATPTPRAVFSPTFQQQPSTSQQPPQYANVPKSAYTNGIYAPQLKATPAPAPPSKVHFALQNRQMFATENGTATPPPLQPTTTTTPDYWRPHQQQQLQQAALAPVPKKVPPPPPPKRSDTTRLQTASVEALHSELEAVMARRLQKIGQL
ncbi:unnamed protein product [Gongylonema pulchrum]|uniref:Neogenin_C domain-containing protein n=1 Tax=Gongylonema pulchrum TaxID=637853 RepID=A0A183CVQ6_9BILA|nr:unnamed protein product [Gongylonema pulchrum]